MNCTDGWAELQDIENRINQRQDLVDKRAALIEEKENNIIRINVSNTGKNIAEEDLPRIWVRFYKVDNSRNREVSGSGIGLSLVRAIMNQHKNKYGVENTKDGVNFYFELNLKKDS